MSPDLWAQLVAPPQCFPPCSHSFTPALLTGWIELAIDVGLFLPIDGEGSQDRSSLIGSFVPLWHTPAAAQILTEVIN